MIRLETADWHIKVPRKKAESEWYYNLIEKFIVKLDETIKEYKVEEMDLLGDVFDKQPTYLDIGMLIKILHTLLRKNKELKINIIHGNHDFHRNNYFLSEFIPFLNSRIKLYTQVQKVGNLMYVDNPYIRYGGEIPKEYNYVLLSHIACELPQFNKGAEYSFDELRKYKLVVLGDIHSAFKIDENIYYTSSPFRTHKLTINSFEEINNSGHGVLVLDTDTLKIKKVEFNLPAKYKLIANKKVEKDMLSKYEDYIEVEYLLAADEFSSIGLEETENVKIIKKIDVKGITKQKNDELLKELLKEKYGIEDPTPYIKVIEKIYPAFLRG